MLETPACANCPEVAELTARVAALEEELRRSKRQRAPFSKDRPKPHPKPPRQKPGHPPAFRAAAAFAQRLLCLPPSAVPLLLAPAPLPP